MDRFGVVTLSYAFDVDLDELAEALELEGASREELIEEAKRDFVGQVLMTKESDMIQFVDVETIIEGLV